MVKNVIGGQNQRNEERMDDFEKKVTITDAMEMEEMDIEQANNNSSKTLQLLRTFLDIQQRRAQAYAKLKRYPPPFLYFCHLIIIIE